MRNINNESVKTDLEIVRTLNRILEMDRNADLQYQRANAQVLENRLKALLGGVADSMEGHAMLRNYLAENPLVLSRLCVETVTEVINFVLASCNHYAQIKSRRNLTQEEKQVGKELSNCLGAARELLDGLRKE